MIGLIMRLHNACVRLVAGKNFFDFALKRTQEQHEESICLVAKAKETAKAAKQNKEQLKELVAVHAKQDFILEAASKNEGIDLPGYRGAFMPPEKVKDLAKQICEGEC